MSGTRVVTVPAPRLKRWLDGYQERHGDYEFAATATGFTLQGRDGDVTTATLPYAPWSGSTPQDAAAHCLLPRRTAVLVIRRGGFLVSVIDRDPVTSRVSVSKLGRRHVQGRTAAGGWSQQRFARRREKQSDELVDAVIEYAQKLLLPAISANDGVPVWLATGGDKPLITAVLDDARLRTLRALPQAAPLTVGDPDKDLLASLPDLVSSVKFLVTS